MKRPLKLLWLATADARGHLMRGQLLWHDLRARGVEVDMWTTSKAGVRFLEACGVPSRMLSPYYAVEFDRAHNMDALGTDVRTARYILDPRRLKEDLALLAEAGRNCDLVINDSFHPALLAAPVVRKSKHLKVVHVYAHQLRPSLEQHYVGRLPGPLARLFSSEMAHLIERAHAQIRHSVSWRTDATTAHEHALPPVMAEPTQRATGPHSDVGVVYLNPHFQDARIAQAIETAFSRLNLRLYGVAEGYPSRPGWRAYDPLLVDKLQSAAVYLSCPGMGAINQALTLGVPFLALATQQPEQLRNLRILETSRATYRLEWLHANPDVDSLTWTLRQLLATPRHAVPAPAARNAFQHWYTTLSHLAVAS